MYQAIWTNYIELGSNAYQAGHYAVAETMLRQAAKVCHKLEHGYPAIAVVLENLASTYCKQNRYAKSERVFKRAIQVHETRSASKTPDICRLTYKLAELHILQQRFPLAQKVTQDALEIGECCNKRDVQMEISHLLRLAALWNQAGQYELAIANYKQVMRLRQQFP